MSAAGSAAGPGVRAAAFVPMTPLFLRHLSGATDPLESLRDAAVEAIRDACSGTGQVLVLCPVGGREAPGDWHDPSRVRPLHGRPRSLAEQVGEHLLELAGVGGAASFASQTAGSDSSYVGSWGLAGSGDEPDELDTELPMALLVLGDGAAARAQAAPGHIDERSFAYDDAVAAALESGDAGALADLATRTEAAELLVTGRHTWPIATSLLPRPVRSRLVHRSDPFGLSYFVATWRA